MVDLEYVKKRRKKKIAAIFSAVGAVGVTTLIIIAFLGRNIGAFSVTLRNKDVQLALATKSTFEDKSSYLMVDNPYGLNQWCYSNFIDEFSWNEVDREDKTFVDFADRDPKTGEINSLRFFKYTFYIRNEKDTEAQYKIYINLVQNNIDTVTGVDLTKSLRVAILEDLEQGGKPNEVYARKSDTSTHIDPDQGDIPTNREYVDGKPYTPTWAGLAVPFGEGTVLAEHEKKDFKKADVHKYTLLYWLEGCDDPDGSGPIPLNSSIKLGVEIKAYENK